MTAGSHGSTGWKEAGELGGPRLRGDLPLRAAADLGAGPRGALPPPSPASREPRQPESLWADHRPFPPVSRIWIW